MSDVAAIAAGYEGSSGATLLAYSADSCDVEPARPTVERAHEIMQRHLSCPTQTCPQRQAALKVLVAIGQYLLPK